VAQEIQDVNPTAGTCIYHNSHCDTQPSAWATCCMLAYCSAQVDTNFYPPWDGYMTISILMSTSNNNNKGQWWMWTIAAYRRIHSPYWLVVTWRWAYIHQMKWVNSRNECDPDNSTINTVSGIITGSPDGPVLFSRLASVVVFHRHRL